MTPVTVLPQPYQLNSDRWRLFKDDGGDLYLLVACDQSFVSFDRLVKLSPAEREDYRGLGWIALQYLAERIQYFSTEYHSRSITGDLLHDAQKARNSEVAGL